MARKKFYMGVVLIMCLLLVMYGGYRFVTHQPLLHKGPSIGIVNMEDVVKLHPSYHEYEKAKRELEAMKFQYEQEQRSLNAKALAQSHALAALSTNPDISQSLTIELQTKILAKEQELNRQLEEKRQALIQEYLASHPKQQKATDLEIVNLQLDLMTYIKRIPYSEAQQEQFAKEKATKEARLQELLQANSPNDKAYNEALMQYVAQGLATFKEEGQRELDAYAHSEQEALMKQRDKMMQEQAQAIISADALPNAAEWNETWSVNLSDKQTEVQALHDAILDDIRARVAAIAKDKHLDLVVTDTLGHYDVLDITDAVKASYKVQ